jgi:hypothetical protein
MKLFKFKLSLLFTVFCLACTHVEELENDVEESKPDERSHNAGKNCSSCHNVNGNEASSEWWTIAGTVYNTNGSVLNNATIELWDGKNRNGQLIKKLTSDLSGNFYTNQIINFKSGLFPVLVYEDSVKTMQSAFNGGSCNSCHNGTIQPSLKIN